MTQCQAKTKSGNRCSRKATDGDYCFQHSKNLDKKKSEPARDDEYNLSRLKCHPEKVAEVLLEVGGHVADAVEMLPISYSTVWEYCQRYDVCKEARFIAKRQTSDLARKTFREMMEFRGDEVSWAEARKAAKNWADLYDDETEADKVDINVSDEEKEKSIKRMLNG